MRQRDFPRQFIVREAIYELEWKRNLAKYLGATDDTMYQAGECDGDNQRILVQQGQGEKQRLMTVAHELIHAFEFEYKIKIPHWLVNRLERPVAEFIINNMALPRAKKAMTARAIRAA